MRQVKYRLPLIIVIFLLMLGVGFLVQITNAGALFSVLAKEFLLENGMPSYSYINNVDTNGNSDVISAIVNDIYPMNEYLMANEVYVDDAVPEDELAVNSDEVIRIVEESTGEAVTKEASAETLSEQQTPQNQMSPEVAAAISRNVARGNMYSKDQLSDYTFAKKFYTVTSITSLTKEIFRPAEFLDKNLKLAGDNSAPQILIFHTHSQETFKDSVANDPSTSIVGVGDYLTKLLSEKYGYNVIHDTGVYDLVDGKLDRSKAYTYAQESIAAILEKYPSIEVVIDLHRDGVPENTHLVTEVDGKKMAKIMFFNGISYSNVNGNIGYLNNPYRDDNLAMSLQMHLLGEAYYPGFLRNIYINAYRYCLHNRGRSMLVEAGAQTNTFDEVKNAMEPFADILDKLLKGQKAY